MKHEKKVVAKKHQNTHQPAANSLSTSQSVPATSSNPQSSTTIGGKTPNKQQSVPAKHLFSESAIRNNFQILEQSRTCQAAVSGIASGILGLTGAVGFLFYFLCIFIQAFIWDYKAGFQWANFFPTRWLLISHALVGGLFTYVLFWVFVYGLVHVY